ncbi:MAG TPA: hypothetical protein VNM14_20745 [Planctomycetota bacterium]|jgi:hypothetical protein|nr:hypothetical protein [Planctomycetota bacterium]
MIRLLLLVLSASALAPTCNIPVFRYALERWQAAPYDVVVFHRGPLGDEGKAALNVLRQAGANVEVDRIDVAEPVPAKRKALLEKVKLEAPFMAAVFPGTEIVAWSGPLSAAAARELTDSPSRREIAKRLLEGESAVWLLLDSGDKAADDAAAKTLEAELARLEQALKLPAHHPDDPPLLSEVAVRVDFSVLRLSRNAPGEASLVRMLLNSESGLEGPIVFPIFGRGRALWAMTGKGLTPPNITEAATFLIGACSCEAKELNPGVDLLFAADWEAGLAAAPARAPVPAPILKPRPVEVPAESAAPAPPREGSRAYLWGALVVAGLLVAITGRRVLAGSR